MRVIFTGSRHWTGIYGEHRAGTVLMGLEVFTTIISSPLVIVHGDCPEGLDGIVDRWAIRHGYEPERHPARWGQFGKQAGHIRNQEMVNQGADMCLGFPLPGSRGTVDCMRRAQLAGIPTFTVSWEHGDEPLDGLPSWSVAA